MERPYFDKDASGREVAQAFAPDRTPVVRQHRENGRVTCEACQSGPAHASPWLSVLLLVALSCSHVAWAEDSPCRDWGKATFVYAADTVEDCLNANIDVNVGINRTGKTPLIGAAQLGDSDAVWLLLAAGADPNKPDRKGGTPLMFAARAGHQEIVRLLAQAGADPNKRNESGWTALLLAIEQEQTAVLGPLAAAGGRHQHSDVSLAC